MLLPASYIHGAHAHFTQPANNLSNSKIFLRQSCIYNLLFIISEQKQEIAAACRSGILRTMRAWTAGLDAATGQSGHLAFRDD
ncbi:MAG TPA: hypothetical protein VL051_02610 [Burkholderiaceae bacterium]|nr:hypothetical protein [Burkholderiaceae bacterium]